MQYHQQINHVQYVGGNLSMESAVYMIYSSGDNGEPCGVPLRKLNSLDNVLSTML